MKSTFHHRLRKKGGSTLKERTVVLEETIVKLAEAKKYASLRDFLATLNPADIAGAFGALSDQALPLVFRLLPKELAAETFVEMETEQQEVLIRGFSDSELKAVVEELYVDDAVELVEEMPANVLILCGGSRTDCCRGSPCPPRRGLICPAGSARGPRCCPSRRTGPRLQW